MEADQDRIVEPDTVLSEGAEMLHNRGAYVHIRPDGVYYLSPHRFETFQTFNLLPNWISS
jgi:hypothetical protein